MNQWIRSWGYPVINLFPEGYDIPQETQRLLFVNNAPGQAVRVRFANPWGEEAIEFDHVTMSIEGSGRQEQVTCGGKSTITVHAGESFFSDPVGMPVAAGDTIIVSTHTARSHHLMGACMMLSQLITRDMHSASTEDLCGAECFDVREMPLMMSDSVKNRFIYGINAVEVETDGSVRAVTAFGDSITNHAFWSEKLTARLYEAYPGKVAVVNSGIGGNRILHDAGVAIDPHFARFGIAAVKRIEQDAFDTKVDLLLFYEGINDLLHPGGHAPEIQRVDGDAILAGIRVCQLIAQLHGARFAGATLTPSTGFHGWNDDKEVLRQQTNALIRQAGFMDMLMDFDAAASDPAAPHLWKEGYHCGDGLHPSEKGGWAMAESVDIARIAELLGIA